MAKPFRVSSPKIKLTDNNNNILSGGQLFFYAAGTTTPINTYPTLTDAINGTNVNPWPVLLDSTGSPSNSGTPIDIFATTSYKLICSPSTDTNPPTNPIWTEDNVTSLAQTVSVQYENVNYTTIASDRDKFFELDASSAGFTITLLPAATAGSGFNQKFKKIDSSTNTVTIQANASELIDSSNTQVLSGQGRYLEIYSDGTQWFSTIGITGSTVNNFNKINIQTFTSSGTYTPSAGMKYCDIVCIGGGGGGGGTVTSNSGGAQAAGGGGAGSISSITSTAATIGSFQTVTVGAAGSAGANTGGTGGNGGTTSVGSICIANGGAGGTGATSGAAGIGGAGGTAGTGTVTNTGQSGFNGFVQSITTVQNSSGAGGSNQYGAGGAPVLSVSASAGNAGTGFGSGGSGAISFNVGGAAVGGVGAAGYVIIKEYISQ